MKVRELMEILSKLDQDVNILCTENSGGEPETCHVAGVESDPDTLKMYGGYIIVGGDSIW